MLHLELLTRLFEGMTNKLRAVVRSNRRSLAFLKLLSFPQGLLKNLYGMTGLTRHFPQLVRIRYFAVIRQPFWITELDLSVRT